MNWMIIEFIKLGIISIVISITFYNSLLGILICVPGWFYFWKQDIQKYESVCRKILREEFKDTLLQVSGNLNAGYSLENAFLQVLRSENIKESKYMLVELKRLAVGLGCNRRIEELLMELGERCQIEEIKDVSNLIVMAKVHGGNIINLIRQTASNLSEKQSVELEINTMVAAKRLEGNIMVLMPFFIVVFMRLTNPAYMTILYNSFLGRIIMTICLFMVAIAWTITNKIMRIY